MDYGRLSDHSKVKNTIRIRGKMKVEFEFEIGQVVETKINGKGIIESASIDENKNIHYFIRLENGNAFWTTEGSIKSHVDE